MEAAALPLCPILRTNPRRPYTSTRNKPAIISRRQGSRIFHERSSFSTGRLDVIPGHKFRCAGNDAPPSGGGDGNLVPAQAALQAFLTNAADSDEKDDRSRGEDEVQKEKKKYDEVIKAKKEYDDILQLKRRLIGIKELQEAARTLTRAEVKVTTEAIQKLRVLYEGLRSEDVLYTINKEHRYVSHGLDFVALLPVEIFIYQKAAQAPRTDAEVKAAVEAIRRLRELQKELNSEVDKEHKGSMGAETYAVGLILVEMLIYQGEYKEAKEVVEHCKGVIPNDVTPKLYQYVICLMEDPEKKDSEAEEFWNKFTKPADADNVSSSSPPKTGEDTNGPTPTIDKDKLEKLTFDQFKVKMKKLREKIEARRKAAMQK